MPVRIKIDLFIVGFSTEILLVIVIRILPVKCSAA